MGRQIQYTKGQRLGNCTFLRDKGWAINPNGKRERLAVFQCVCGTEFIARINNIKSLHTTSCGCIKIEKAIEQNTSHGLKKHRLYGVWNGIKSRCQNSKSKAYERYGGRGISVYSVWVNDFKAFFDYVTRLPGYNEPGMTLDRIDNNGNYEPGNLRWTDKCTQAINRKAMNRLGYTGVYKKKNRFQAGIRVNRKMKWIGTFDSPEDAVEARNKYILDNNLSEYKLQTTQRN